MTDHTDLVQRLHAAQPPTSGDLASCFAFELRVLAALPPDEHWGLLQATGGDNVTDYQGQPVKVGRVCDPLGNLAKLLTDIPTTNGPQWALEAPVDPGRYLAYVRGPIDPPVDPPTDAIDVIDAQLTQILAMLATLLARPAPVYRAPIPANQFGVSGDIVLKPDPRA